MTRTTLQTGKIGWIRALATAVAADIVLVGLAFVWVAVWAHGFDPGHDEAHYQAYAALASPWVSVLAGIPLFHLGARWIARRHRPRGMAQVLAVVGIYVALDAAIITAFATNLGCVIPMSLLSFSTKLVAAWTGARASAARV